MSYIPASKEAKEQGCICHGDHEIEVECPIHFPLYYLDLVKNLEQFILKTMKHEKYLQYILISLVAIDIIARLMNCN